MSNAIGIRTLHNTPVVGSVFEQELHVLGGVHSVESIHERLVDTATHKALRAMDPRFSRRYGWHDLRKFAEYFGPDVAPDQHGLYQARTIGIPLVTVQEQTEEFPLPAGWKHPFIAHAVEHDNHEGVYHARRGELSDTPAPEKDEDSAATEFECFIEVQEGIWGEDYEPQRRHAEMFEGVSVNTPEEANASALWSGGESLGYIATAIRGLELAHFYKGLSSEERQKSLLLARTVISDEYASLVPLRPHVPFADQALTQIEPSIAILTTQYGVSREELTGLV